MITPEEAILFYNSGLRSAQDEALCNVILSIIDTRIKSTIQPLGRSVGGGRIFLTSSRFYVCEFSQQFIEHELRGAGIIFDARLQQLVRYVLGLYLTEEWLVFIKNTTTTNSILSYILVADTEFAETSPPNSIYDIYLTSPPFNLTEYLRGV